jgi:hypothetical protein
MFRQIIFTIIFIGSYLSSPILAVGQGPAYRFLKEPAVKWNDERLTGEVINAPVKNLITELLQMAGYNWEVIGKLEGKISISFDHLTISESINKIMRISRYNYALIFEEQESFDSMSTQNIKELTIYQKDQRIRFSRTQKQISKPQKEKITKASNTGTPKSVSALPAKPAAKKPKLRNTRQSEPTREEIAVIEEEIKAFADEMLAEKKITMEEYKELIKGFDTKK